MKTILLALSMACVALGQPVVRRVCASGCDYSNLQTAINAAQRGWVLILNAGENYDTTTGFTLPAKTGQGWITLRSSRLGELRPNRRVSPSDAALMPKLRTGTGFSSYVMLTTGEPSAYWRFEGLEFTLTTTGLGNTGAFLFFGRKGDNSPEDSPEKTSNHFEIDRCYLHGLGADNGPRRAIIHNSGDISITNSFMDEIKLESSESHVTLGSAMVGPMRFINNTVRGGSIGTLLGGGAMGVRGTSPMFLTFNGNFWEKPADHSVKRYRADPIGTVLPTTGSLTAAQPQNGQTFFRTDTATFHVYHGTGWTALSGVAANQICFSGEFWRNESTTPSYWRCTGGTWVSTPTDAAIAGGSGSFNGFQHKNFLETKHSMGMFVEGNYFGQFVFPGAQNGATVHANFNSSQSQLGSTTSFSLVENNRMVASGIGLVQTYNLLEADIASISNTNPAVVTISTSTARGVPTPPSANLEGCPVTVRFRGATGNWAALNDVPLQATGCSGNSFSINFDGTGRGALTGTVVYSDESSQFLHKLPREWTYRNNHLHLATGPNLTGLPNYFLSGTALTNQVLGYGIALMYDATVVDHNTFTLGVQANDFRPSVLALMNNRGVSRFQTDFRVRDVRLTNNIKEGGQYVLRATSQPIGVALWGCESLAGPYLDLVSMRRNVIVNTGTLADSTTHTLFQNQCVDWAWPWRRNGAGVASALTGGTVAGGLLTLNFAGSHGLLQNTRFRITAPAALVGSYTVPLNNALGSRTRQTDTSIIVPTSAASGSYSGITIEAAADFADPANLNFRLASSSLYKGTALDGADPGANFSAIDWATATAISGDPNPYLTFRIRQVQATATVLSGRFTAFSTNACTWEASRTRAYSPLEGTVSQTRAGREGTFQISGLSANTGYWLRATCDGRQREELVLTKP